ncbi:capsid protein [Lactobacillus acidophilus]|uniref:capsid protein n=1 Tax=Lactobacillus acidophilus TaxID=1579 RepID=UPI001969F00A|nr:capsid protein [Lactobacillus acidophilus]
MFTYLLITIFGIGLLIWAFWYDKNMFKPEKKKNGKMTKPLHTRWYFWVLVVFSIVGGIGNMLGLGADDDDSDNNYAQTVQTSKKAKQSKAENHSKAKKSGTKKSKEISDEEKEAASLLLLRKNFKGKAKVWYDSDNKAFMIQPTGTEFKEELLDIIATQDTSDWKDLTDSMDSLSRSLYNNLQLADFVSIVNPDNPDKVLYSSLNGHSEYDFLKDDE